MVLYGLKNCDTCRKALKSLPGARLIDLRQEALPEDVLSRAHAHFGSALLNKRSTTWRALSEDERARPETDLLRAHPALMKRPLIVDGEALHLGWSPDVRAALGVA
ncbi:MAG: ArsC/Spx/MgsR family protein [Paracoccaceae bacterium]